MEYNQALLQYLSQFISDKRAEMFRRVLERRTRHFAISLEDIFQPHNANAVIRSADCFGIQDIYTIETINAFNPSRGVSKGAIKWVNRTSFDNFEEAFELLRAKDYQIVATTPHKGDCDLDHFDISKKSVFFFGAEKKGISEKTMQNADTFLKIPMQGFTESLNISVSAAIIMQHLTHKLREQNEVKWQLSQEEKEELFLDWIMKSVPRIEKHLKVFRQNWNKSIS